MPEKIEWELLEKDAANVDEGRRKFAFQEAVRNRDFSSPVDMDSVIEDALKIEAFLRGDLEDPNS